MDLEQETEARGSSCSICLELVLDLGQRSVAKLQCGHEFHLDCIGSAFNAKGAMQCPNCRKVEKGHWLYANGHHSEFVAEDAFDLNHSELPFVFQWCPVRGLTQLASFIEEGERPLHSSLREHPSTSNTHVCPYLVLHGFRHPVHPAPSSVADSIPESGPFHRHPTTSFAGQFSGDMINSHNFSATEQQTHSWSQQLPLSYSDSGNTDQSTTQLPSRLSRIDTSAHQRLGSFIHPHTLLHGHVTRTRSNMVAPLGQPVIGEVRGHTRGHGGPIYQQHVSSSSLRASPFAPIRRPRPRALSILSSNISSSPQTNGFYGFSVSTTVNTNNQNGESQFYGWGREEESARLPWTPGEGESRWWRPFHSSQNPLSRSADLMARNFHPQRAAGEGVAPPRIPPYM